MIYLNLCSIVVNNVVSIRDFGASGDGSDQSGAIDRAIEHAIAYRRSLFWDGGDYLYGGFSWSDAFSLNIIGDPANPPVIRGTQALADDGGELFRLQRTTYDAEDLTLGADTTPGDRTITLGTGEGAKVSAGQIIQICSTKLWFHDHRDSYYRGEIHRIFDVSGDTVTIEDIVRDTYATTDTLTIRAWTPDHVAMKDLRLVMPKSNAGKPGGIQIDRCIEPTFDGIEVEGTAFHGILSMRGWHNRWRNIRGRNIGRGDGGGYCVQDRGGVGTVVDGLRTYGCRRAFDAHSLSGAENGAPARDWSVTNFHIVGGGPYFPDTADPSYGLGNHGPSENGLIAHGYIMAVTEGAKIRGRNTRINDVQFTGPMDTPVGASFGAGLEVTNCRYDRGDEGKLLDFPDSGRADVGCLQFVRFGMGAGSGEWDWSLPVAIEGNTALGARDGFVTFSGNGNVQSLTCRNNHVEFARQAGGQAYLFNTENPLNISRSQSIENTVSVVAGGYHDWHPDITIGYYDDDDCAVRMDGRTWYATIPHNKSVRILSGAAVPGARLMVAVDTGPGGSDIYAIVPENGGGTSYRGGPGVSNIDAIDTVPTGTTGPDGQVNIHLDSNGRFYGENRTGATRLIRIQIIC